VTAGGVAEALQKKIPPKKKDRAIPTTLDSNNMPALASDTFDLPLAKRQKTVIDQKYQTSRAGSKIFAPFRVCFGSRCIWLEPFRLF